MAYTKKNWKDFPDTNTPITTEGLQNIEDGIENVDNRLSDEEIYTTATAGANGDFHVTLTNTTLTNGRVVKISFPTATNGKSNARLSIDGGSNYNFIAINENIEKAESVENDKLELVYDAENWQIIKATLDYIVVSVNSSSFTLPGTVGIVEFNHVYDSGRNSNKLSLNEKGQIVIGAGVSKIRTWLNFWVASTTRVWIETRLRNSADTSNILRTGNVLGYPDGYFASSIAPITMDVEEGQRVEIYYSNHTADIKMNYGSGQLHATLFTVEVIK